MAEPIDDTNLPIRVTTLVRDTPSEAAEYLDTPDTYDSFMKATEPASNGGMRLFLI
jgi:hypothetical protein